MSSYCDISKFSSAQLTALKNGSGVSQPSITNDDFACYASYKLGTAREKLDASLVDIYQPDNSKTATFDSNYQATMLTGIVWAALGTTVLYYAFTKI